MSRDLLVINTQEAAPASHSTSDRPRASASALVEDLLARVQREWSEARPQTESLWQLAGE